MADLDLLHMALRNHALNCTIVTTGDTTLSATTTGYRRASGSFLTDGFRRGMEITPAGFTANPVDVVVHVTATDLQVRTSRAAQSAGASRSITVGIPAVRLWENDVVRDGSAVVQNGPISDRPYIEEEFIPSANLQRTFGRADALREERGLYVLKWYGLSTYAHHALRRQLTTLADAFAPLSAALSDGSTYRIRGNPGPYAGQILQRSGGWALCTLTVPWAITTRRSQA